MPVAGTKTDAAQRELARRGLENIRRRLLDLTNRNKLIRFRHGRSSLRIVNADLDAVYQNLVDDKRFPLVYVRDVGPETRRPVQASLLTKFALPLLLLSSFSLAHGQGCPTGQQKYPATLVQIEQVWVRAVEQHDKAALGCILADEFEEADFDGSLIDRSAMLAIATKPSTVHFEFSDLHTHVHGNFAYVRGVGATRSDDGKFHAKNRYGYFCLS